MSRWALPAAFALFGVLVVVVPLVRLYLRAGVFGLVPHRQTDLRHAALGAAFALSIAAIGAFGAGVGALGPVAMGVQPLPAWVSVAGAVGMGLATVYVMVAQAQMGSSWRIGIDDRPTALVATGLYRFSRHPIYTGLFAWLWSAVLVAPAPALIGLALATTTVVTLQARAEEAHLVTVHGDLYREYQARVGRFFPRLR